MKRIPRPAKTAGIGLALVALPLGGMGVLLRGDRDKAAARAAPVKMAAPQRARPAATAKPSAPTVIPKKNQPVAHDHAPDEGHHEGCGPNRSGLLPDGADPDRPIAEKARALAQGPHGELVAALRRADPKLAQAILAALLDDAMTLCDRELLDRLHDLARDRAVEPWRRALVLDVLGQAAGTDAQGLGRIAALANETSLDPAIREAATGALQRLSLERPDLRNEARTALLDAAERAPSPQVRADALDAIQAGGARDEEVSRLAGYLADPDPEVRAASARALATSDLQARSRAAPALERAIFRERDADAASAILASAVRVGRGETAALIERMASAPIVRENASLARQVADYRAALARGETDPSAILQDHLDREDARLGE